MWVTEGDWLGFVLLRVCQKPQCPHHHGWRTGLHCKSFAMPYSVSDRVGSPFTSTIKMTKTSTVFGGSVISHSFSPWQKAPLSGVAFKWESRKQELIRPGIEFLKLGVYLKSCTVFIPRKSLERSGIYIRNFKFGFVIHQYCLKVYVGRTSLCWKCYNH